MKTKAFGKQTYLIKFYYRDAAGKLAQLTETWYNIKNARRAYEDKCRDYGEDNVFIFKAKQIMFTE